jgi:hypothetical protein
MAFLASLISIARGMPGSSMASARSQIVESIAFSQSNRADKCTSGERVPWLDDEIARDFIPGSATTGDVRLKTRRHGRRGEIADADTQSERKRIGWKGRQIKRVTAAARTGSLLLHRLVAIQAGTVIRRCRLPVLF